MSNQGKFIITAALCVTAVLILCTLVIVDHQNLSQAQASSSPDRQGDYILVPGARVQGDDVVYVIDVAARKMIAYWANANNNRIVAHAVFDLAKLPQ